MPFLRIQFLVLYPSKMYIYPLTDVIDDNKRFYHVYADDTQLYCSSPSDKIDTLLDKISTSTDDINLWMSANKLKMNNFMICFMDESSLQME